MEPVTPPLPEPPPRGRSFRAAPWRLPEVLVALAPLFALRIATAVAGTDWMAGWPVWVYFATLVAGELWMLGLPIVVARWRLGRFPRLPRWPNAVIEALLGLPLVVGVWAVLLVVVLVWTVVFGQPNADRISLEPIVRSHNWLALALVSVLIVVIGPIAEELLFRGMVYNALRRRLPVLVAAVIQAVAFGINHEYGAMQTTVVSVVGLCLALIYEWRRSLVAPIVVHGLFNASVLAIALLQATLIKPPMIGVNGEAAGNGVRVTLVAPGSGADEAGVQVGDVITAIDGQQVSDIRDIANVVRKKHVGETVTLELLRDDRPVQLQVVLKARE